MRILLIHVRSSPLRWAVPVLTALSVGFVLTRGNDWVGIWYATGAVPQMFALYLSIAAAGLAAWEAGATRRHSLDEQLDAAGLHPARIAAPRLGIVVLLLLLPYLAGHVVAVVTSFPAAAHGLDLWAAYVLMGVVIIVMAVSWGWAIGSHVSSLFAAITAVLSWFIVAMLVDGLGELFKIGPEVWESVSLWTVAARLGAICAVAIGLLWISRGRSIARFAAPLPGLLALVATLAMPVVGYREPPEDVACAEGPITMCVWPDHTKYLSTIADLSARAGTLPEVLVVPDRMMEHHTQQNWELILSPRGNLVEAEIEGDFDPTFSISAGSPWSISMNMATAVIDETFGSCDWDAMWEDGNPTEALSKWIEGYLVGGSSPDYTTDAPPEVVAEWERGLSMVDASDDEYIAWVTAEVEAIRAGYC